ncbi:MAG TPA: 5'-methylthioadenosine/S-adenosylhomocysteine nucleosidase [Stellaceae bacterium]|nr:5'-methylthioadenosine/S-adenosylhomocysteine nucleosidase [Stellaceae bacterium]
MKPLSLLGFLLALCVALAAAPAAAVETLDSTPRTAVMSAFRPEWTALQARLRDRRDYLVNGATYSTGTIEGRPVVLFLSGVSMVNASMTAQLVLDRFAVERIVFSGIAGGVDPDLSIGDVAVPSEWSEYLEAVFARKTAGGYVVPGFFSKSIASYGMIFPQPVEIARENGDIEKRQWFPVDADLLALARKAAAATALQDCTAERRCLKRKPRIVVGGRGVSGQAFVDNKAFRLYVRKTFGAEVLDMESAAVAHVAYLNKVPFIAFRSLSDLAGGGPEENELGTFFQLAADNSAAVVVAFLRSLP